MEIRFNVWFCKGFILIKFTYCTAGFGKNAAAPPRDGHSKKSYKHRCEFIDDVQDLSKADLCALRAVFTLEKRLIDELEI